MFAHTGLHPACWENSYELHPAARCKPFPFPAARRILNFYQGNVQPKQPPPSSSSPSHTPPCHSNHNIGDSCSLPMNTPAYTHAHTAVMYVSALQPCDMPRKLWLNSGGRFPPSAHAPPRVTSTDDTQKRVSLAAFTWAARSLAGSLCALVNAL